MPAVRAHRIGGGTRGCGGAIQSLQLRHDLLEVGEALLGIRFGQSREDPLQAHSEPRARPGRRGVLPGSMTEDHLVQHDPDGVLVRTVPVRAFRREVGPRPSPRSGLERPHHPVVRQLPASSHAQHVGGLDVAVPQPHGLEEGKPLRHRSRDLDHLARLDLPALLHEPKQGHRLVAVREERPLDDRIGEVHHAVDEAIRLPDVLRPEQMILPLADALAEHLQSGQLDLAVLRRNELDRDGVGGVVILRDPDAAEPALPDLREQPEVRKHRRCTDGTARDVPGGRRRTRSDGRSLGRKRRDVRGRDCLAAALLVIAPSVRGLGYALDFFPVDPHECDSPEPRPPVDHST